MRGVAKQLIFYGLLSFFAGWAVFVFNPIVEGDSGDELLVDWDGALALGDVLWVDARTEEEFEKGHFRDAILLNEEDWELGFVALLDRWGPDQSIVVYCSSEACLRSHHVAARLRRELGWDQIFALGDGWGVLQNK